MKFATKRDVIIIAVLTVVCILVWIYFSTAFGQPGKIAEIYYKSELVKTVDLSAGLDERFSIPQVPNVVFELFPDGTIAFVESDCPDKICIRTGRLHQSGHMAACLPNQIHLKIVSTSSVPDDAPDIVIG